ncbi:MAG: lactonase family protein [marine benthic group bacterium]|nr:lactonase family protein [Gemmatimonadota bacterium]
MAVPAVAGSACDGDGGAMRPSGSGPTYDAPALLVTVAVADVVLRLDPETGALLERIPVDPRPSESDEPHGVAVSPDGAHWYVTLAHGDPTLSKFEREGDRLVGRGSLLSAGAARVELSPDGAVAYIADYDRSMPGSDGEVVAIRTRDLELQARNRICEGPHHALPDPSARVVAVACSLGDEIVILDASDLSEIRRFPVDPDPGEPGFPRFKPLNLAWSSDGDRLYVALHLADRVRVFDAGGAIIGEVATGRRPAQIAVSEDESILVAANRGDGTLSVIDGASLEETSRIDLGAAHPHGVVLGGSAETAFVTCEGTTGTPGRTVAVSLGPEPGVAWSTETGPVPLGIAWMPPARP